MVALLPESQLSIPALRTYLSRYLRYKVNSRYTQCPVKIALSLEIDMTNESQDSPLNLELSHPTGPYALSSESRGSEPYFRWKN